MKNRIASVVALLIVAATVGAWAYLSANSPAGNLFSGSAPTQMLLYGRLCGLLAALCFVFLMLSMGKGRTLERFFPKAQLVKLHRRLGFGVLLLVLAHFGLIFSGRAALYEEPFGTVVRAFFLDGKWGSSTLAGLVVLCAVLLFCALFVWKKMPFPKWKPTHYAVYAVVLLLFGHQIFCGFDLGNSMVFFWCWTALFAVAFLDAAIWRGKQILTTGSRS